MRLFARTHRVYVWEEPIADLDQGVAHLSIDESDDAGVTVVTPHVRRGAGAEAVEVEARRLLSAFVAERGVGHPVAWYYTPMMLGFSREVAEAAGVVVYDCMDELANFKFAPDDLKAREADLLAMADVVFTGGWSLYEAKRSTHANIHPFPSAVDKAHFAKARTAPAAPADQHGLPWPRFGFFGVIDERFDADLLAHLADARPLWAFVIVGPVVKIDEASLPQRANIHYLGGKPYDALPAHLARWDVAIMPFAINASTRFISPTKTPEFLAGGRPVVSTAIADVSRHYGHLHAVTVAEDADAFLAGCERALELSREPDGAWLAEADAMLAELSWEKTQSRMAELIDRTRRGGPIVLSPADRPRPPAAPAIWPSDRNSHVDALVVGAGFAGAVTAERLAAAGKRVRVIDKRPHIGGNAYDTPDAAGVLHHVYGPHIFHTNSDEVFAYLSQFTKWRAYEHRVLADVGGRLVPIPINRTTLNVLYGLNLTSDAEAAAFFAARAEPAPVIRTSEDVVVSAVGRELYEIFFRGYTRKQWGLDPSELDKAVTARVPTRTNEDDRYFTDAHQAMPRDGYTAMFEHMLDHPNIAIETGTTFAEVKDDLLFDRLVWTGPVDEFFGHRFGPLPYRSLRFEHQTLDRPWFQPTAVVNYPSVSVAYTRITEYKHLTGQAHAKTSITREYPSDVGDPYYPIPNAEAQALYKRYEALALTRADVDFVGRLATYRYYNMDQVVGQALARARKAAAADRPPPTWREVTAVGAE